MLAFIFFILIHIIFGLITRRMNKNKGYNGGFAWGFFLALIGIIVVACKSDKNKDAALSVKGNDFNEGYYDNTTDNRFHEDYFENEGGNNAE